MHDSLVVRRRERGRNLTQHAHRLVDRQFSMCGEPRAERLTTHEGHREIRQAADLAGGEEWHDVRMLQLGGERDLAAKTVDRQLTRHRLGEDLDGDVAVERRLERDEHA